MFGGPAARQIDVPDARRVARACRTSLCAMCKTPCPPPTAAVR
ncbi:hypothetical protein I551_4363 [Mycobacterium ulcerans str. Harvey]|uniref:Uncharacterized protein n=1 Tax=Mycobacterium ulcerans str. Harvey TaxID=1299332 RepID=A0ABN0QWM0_MYCUL|nr:hypothetical protein I551_4363 [Mycobacterium ulcerans str. Harvey]